MSDFWPFVGTIAVKDLRREAIAAQFGGSGALGVLSSEQMRPVNRPKRMVVGEKSRSSGYFVTFEAEQRLVRERFVAQFDNCYLHTPKFYLFDAEKQLLLDSIPPARRQDPSALRESEELNRLQVTEIEDDVIICGVHNYDNYFHWHVDCLSGLLLAERAGAKGKVLVPPLSSWRRASLSYMGLSADDVVPCSSGILHLKRAYWPSSLVRRGFHMTDDVVEAFDRIRRGAQRAGKLTAPSAEKVYIGRTDTSVRQLINERDLIQVLEQHGFTILTPGLQSYEDQIALMVNARVIVALHGAGLANMGFAPVNCNIIEIFPETFLNNGYFGMSQVTQQNYHCYSRNTLTGENTASGQPSHWEIEIQDFIQSYGDLL
jgi:capsular polysaccharide biosynthesis protein